MTLQTSLSTTIADILSALSDNAIYTDIKQMYTDGIIDNKTFESLMVQFQQIAFQSALQIARDFTLQLQTVTVGEGATAKEYTAGQVDILKGLEQIELLKEQTAAEAEQKLLIEKQVDTEIERKALLETQKNGFLDNRVIKLLENIRGLVGEIESGGLENPQENWDMLYSAINAMATIASAHPQIGGAITVPTTIPTGT